MEKRFFINESDIFKNTITLQGEEHNHLANVLRARVGQVVECFYNGSDIYKCEIATISKNNTVLNIVEVVPNLANPVHQVTLFQGLPKLDKLELVIQKCAELGVAKIVPFTSQHTIAKPNDNKLDRLNKISISASKQCGSTQVLQVMPTINFKQLISELKQYDIVVFANEKEQTSSLKELLIDKQNVAIVVGSEGGFSSQEIETLIQNGAMSITLGKRILRTETACIVVSALVMDALGELN